MIAWEHTAWRPRLVSYIWYTLQIRIFPEKVDGRSVVSIGRRLLGILPLAIDARMPGFGADLRRLLDKVVPTACGHFTWPFHALVGPFQPGASPGFRPD